MIRRPPRSTLDRSSAASDVYKRQVLYGVQGLFHATPGVSRAAFHRYVESLGLPHRYPQVRSITYAPVVPHDDRADFERAVRADASVEASGYPDFTVRPPGDRLAYVLSLIHI